MRTMALDSWIDCNDTQSHYLLQSVDFIFVVRNLNLFQVCILLRQFEDCVNLGQSNSSCTPGEIRYSQATIEWICMLSVSLHIIDSA